MKRQSVIEPEVLSPGDPQPESSENLPDVIRPNGVLFGKRMIELEERLIDQSVAFDEACQAIEDAASQRVADAQALQAHLKKENLKQRKSWSAKFGIKWGSNGA